MKIKGLKKVSGESKKLSGHYSPEYLQLNYNTKTGEAWINYHYSIGHNSWTEYHEPEIITCGNITEPKTQKELAAMIHDAILKDLYRRLDTAKETAAAARIEKDYSTALAQDALADDIRLYIREEKAKEDHTRHDFYAGIHKAL